MPDNNASEAQLGMGMNSIQEIVNNIKPPSLTELQVLFGYGSKKLLD